MAILESLEMLLDDEKTIEYINIRREAVLTLPLAEDQRTIGELYFDDEVLRLSTTDTKKDPIKIAADIRDSYLNKALTIEDIKNSTNPDIISYFAALGNMTRPNSSAIANRIISELPKDTPRGVIEYVSACEEAAEILEKSKTAEFRALAPFVRKTGAMTTEIENRRARDKEEKQKDKEEIEEDRYYNKLKYLSLIVGGVLMSCIGSCMLFNTGENLKGNIDDSYRLQKRKLETVQERVNEVEQNLGEVVSRTASSITSEVTATVASTVEQKVQEGVTAGVTPVYQAQQKTQQKVEEYQRQQGEANTDLQRELTTVRTQLQETMDLLKDRTSYLTDTLRESADTRRPITPNQRKELEQALNEANPNIGYLRQNLNTLEGQDKRKAQRLIGNYERAQRILQSYGIGK